jgi:hypothetical protein
MNNFIGAHIKFFFLIYLLSFLFFFSFFKTGVFEGSCRAVYAELFTGEELSTAFSGQVLIFLLHNYLAYSFTKNSFFPHS